MQVFKNKLLSVLIFLYLIQFSNPVFSDMKLICDVAFNGIMHVEKTKYKGSVILNISEFKDYLTFEIDEAPVFMKIDNMDRSNYQNINLIDNSDAGKWDISVVKRNPNGSEGFKKILIDRNTGKIKWTDQLYIKYPTQLGRSDELVGLCKKIDISKKLF